MRFSPVLLAIALGLCGSSACGNKVSGKDLSDGKESSPGEGGTGGTTDLGEGGEGDPDTVRETPGDGGTGGGEMTGGGGGAQVVPSDCNEDEECPNSVPLCEQDSGKCGPCTSDDACAARSSDSPFCAEGACVACAEDEDCTEEAPVCGQGGVCRGCAAHDECASLACDLDAGTCVPESKVVYILAKTGAGTNCGSRELPCYGPGPALPLLSTFRNTLVLQPTTATLNDAGGLVLPAITGLRVVGHQVKVSPADGKPALSMSGGDVVIDGLSAEADAEGVRCTGGTLTVLRSTFTGNSAGISATDCEINVQESRFLDNDAGIRGSGDTYATIARNWIEGGLRGIDFNSAIDGFRIENNVIVNNVSLYSYDSAAMLYTANPSVFSYNTLYGNAANQTYNGVVYAVGSPLTMSSNISWGNCNGVESCQEFAGLTQATLSHTLSMQPYPGVNNASEDPLFVAPEADDFSLAAGSPAIDTGNPVDAPVVDFFGNPRTVGAGPDRGAIEVQ